MKIYCKGCRIYVGEIKGGSRLIKGIVYLCPNCEIKRKASDLASKTKKDDLSELFKGFGGFK